MQPFSEVSSLSEFMKWVQAQQARINQEYESTQELFYRGHSDESYRLEPGAYRKNKDGSSYRAVEYHLYQEMLRRNTSIFSEDKTTFEKLVRMQHYGLPTRLLDLTQSPLVALYFACKSGDKNGEIILFNLPRLHVSHPPHVSEASMAGLDASLNFENIGALIAERFCTVLDSFLRAKTGNQKIDDAVSIFVGIFNTQKDMLNSQGVKFSQLCNSIGEIEAGFERLSDAIDNAKNGNEPSFRLVENLFSNFFNIFVKVRDGLFSELCGELNFKDFYRKKKLNDFMREFTFYNIVFPPLNNERIRRQQGAFLVFPPIESGCTPEDFYNSSRVSGVSGVTVLSAGKESILRELSHLGITDGYLFPEPEVQAKEIISRYPAQI